MAAVAALAVAACSSDPVTVPEDSSTTDPTPPPESTDGDVFDSVAEADDVDDAEVPEADSAGEDASNADDPGPEEASPTSVADADAPDEHSTVDVARTTDDRVRDPRYPSDVTPDGFDQIAVRVTSAEGDVCDICLWRAHTQQRRSRGLMEVTDLGEPVGMLFSWDTTIDSSFFMFNTPMPLSIAWFADDGAFVDTADMEPCIPDPTIENPSSTNCPLYGAAGPYQWAIEMVQGELDVVGIGPGSTIEVIDDSGCPPGILGAADGR